MSFKINFLATNKRSKINFKMDEYKKSKNIKKNKKDKKNKRDKKDKKDKKDKDEKKNKKMKFHSCDSCDNDSDDDISQDSLEITINNNKFNNFNNNDKVEKKSKKKDKKIDKKESKKRKRKRDKQEQEQEQEQVETIFQVNYKKSKQDMSPSSPTITKSKKQEEEEEEEEKNEYPYPVDDDDHCETPLDAYKHLNELLEKLCEKLNKTKSELKIWDPFYCTGKMKEHLIILGYNKNNIYNKCEDFYQKIKIENGGPPEHDCIITNPPYSENHMEAICNYCYYSSIEVPETTTTTTSKLGNLNKNKPCFILMPSFVMLKSYWLNICNNTTTKPTQNNNYYSRNNNNSNMNIITLNKRICYVAPRKRYQYSTPYGRRQAKSAIKTSPFPSIWFCILDSKRNINNNNYNEIDEGKLLTCDDIPPIKNTKSYKLDHYVLNTSTDKLPLDVLPEQHPMKRREKNNKKRKKK